MKIKASVSTRWRKAAKRDVLPRVKDLTFENYNLLKDGITQSLIMSFLKCPREFLFKVNKWTSEGKKTAFAFGSITHDTLDRCYTFAKRRGKRPSDKLIEKWALKYEANNPGWLPANKQQDAERYTAVCIVVVQEYCRIYKRDFARERLVGAEDIFDIK